MKNGKSYWIRATVCNCFPPSWFWFTCSIDLYLLLIWKSLKKKRRATEDGSVKFKRTGQKQYGGKKESNGAVSNCSFTTKEYWSGSWRRLFTSAFLFFFSFFHSGFASLLTFKIRTVWQVQANFKDYLLCKKKSFLAKLFEEREKIPMLQLLTVLQQFNRRV